MGTDRAAGQNGRIFGFGRHDNHLREFRLEDGADSRKRAACAEACAECVNLLISKLFQNFLCGFATMDFRIVRVGELLRNEAARNGIAQFDGLFQAVINAFTDVVMIGHEHEFSTVEAENVTSFLRNGIRHDDDAAVLLDGADESQTDALIAGCRLDNDGAFMDKPFFFSGFNHIEGRSGLDATANIDGLHFDQNAGVIR